MSFEKGHALIIGVGNYMDHPNLNVEITVKDATAIDLLIKDPQFCGYPADQVTFLSRENATKEKIEAAFADLAAKADEESTVFIYLASHGDFGTDDSWYFLPHDVAVTPHPTQNKVQVLPDTGISEPRFVDMLRAIKAQKLIIFFNTCFSGNVSGSLGTALEDGPTVDPVNPTQDGINALLGTGEGRIIITAAGEDQKSWFNRFASLTIFTDSLLDGLKGIGVADRGGFISAFDLYTALYYTVIEKGSQLGELAGIPIVQEPEITVLKGVGPFPIALHQNPVGSLGGAGLVSEEVLKGNIKEKEVSEVEEAIKRIMGDKVEGDKNVSNISTGSINNSSNIAIGPNASVNVNQNKDAN